MAGEPAAGADAYLAERKIDLVVDHEHVVELVTLNAPRAGPTESPASFMYVIGSRIATRGPPGPVRPSVSSPRYFDLAFGSAHRLASSLATSNPML